MITAIAFPEQSNMNEKKAKYIALLITACVATLLLLILILIRIITPIPAIPPPVDVPTVAVEFGIEPGSGGDAAMMGGGSNGNTGTPGMQNPTDANNPEPKNPTDNGAVTDNNSDNPSATNSNHTSTSTQTTVSNDVLAAIANFNKNKGKASIKLGGQGSGDPYTGGLGNGTGTGLGPANGGDKGTGGPGGNPNGTADHGTYRHIIFKPEIVNPTQEEGKVVVIVHVDRSGNVTKADVGTATTTINSVLRSTATQSAYHIKFDEDQSGPVDTAIAIEIYFTLK
jgi:colicin import membrane protein